MKSIHLKTNPLNLQREMGFFLLIQTAIVLMTPDQLKKRII